MYCRSCGRAVDEGNAFCPHCGAQISGSPAAPVAPQVEKYTPAAKKKPRTGYFVTLIGGGLIFLSGIGYLILGNPAAGVLGIIFGILVVVFARRLHAAADLKAAGIYGMIPFFIGWFVLLASGTLLPFDLVVSLSGVFAAIGSSAMLAGK